MKKLPLAAVIVTLLLGVSAGALGRGASSAEPDVLYWHYTITTSTRAGDVVLWGARGRTFDKATSAIDMLNAMGKDGWELVTVVREHTGATENTTYYFRKWDK